MIRARGPTGVSGRRDAPLEVACATTAGGKKGCKTLPEKQIVVNSPDCA
jgi:hypothetical protein